MDVNVHEIIVLRDKKVQARTHKKKRINKKWAKRYGFKTYENQLFKNGQMIVMGQKKYMNERTYSVIWDCADGYEHVSVSPQKRYNVPTWNDMCTLKDIFFDDEEEAYQIHPKKSQYVNGVENCLHLWKPIGHEIDELVTK